MMSSVQGKGSRPGFLSRLAFRLMAWYMDLSRRSVDIESKLRASGVAEGQTVLDFGCGPGHFATAAAQMVGDKGRVYALDIQPAAARMVEKRAQEQGLKNIYTIVSDRETGLADGSVGVVLMYDMLHLVKDKRGVLEEVERVLEEEGVLSLWVEHEDPAQVVEAVQQNSRFVLRERRDDVLNFQKRAIPLAHIESPSVI
jgi:ubiquinone/menaquinone biosynthesis C-methylase UbiE